MSSDCGGGSTVSSGRRSTGSVSSTKKSMSTTPKSATAAGNGNGNGEGDAIGAVGAGPIVRLNPTDGLFLKAEHLNQMQDYARALSLAVGLGTGTGVVYGYGLAITGSTLTATAGLAINPSGHPLQTSGTLQLSVAADDLPALDPDGFWVVEIVPDSDTTGTENAYGAVCADPCEGVDSIAPWARSLVRLRLRPDTVAGLDEHIGARRNWLASAYFERERRQSQPWLVPGERLPGAPGTVAPLASRPWAEPGTQPTGAAVPLGVLLLVEGELVLDTWTARRELSGPPGERRWDGHLARRPWTVFLAQVLQLADQIAAESIVSGTVVKQLVVDRRGALVARLIEQHPEETPLGRLKDFQSFVSQYQTEEDPFLLTGKGQTLRDLGLLELPPAGYLTDLGGEKAGRAAVARLFDDTVDLRFCEVRADYVAGAVQAAQHLDRIPLDTSSDPRPQVDILVPVLPADLEGLKTDAYGWVAFVRRSERRCEDEDNQLDPVDVYLSAAGVGDTRTALRSGALPGDTQALGQIDYAPNRVELPTGVDTPDLSHLGRIVIFGVAVEGAAKEVLMGERAKVLTETWTSGGTPEALVSGSFSRPLLVIAGIPI
jgi:hypothetical protein